MLIRKVENDAILFCDGIIRILTIGEKETDEGILLELRGQLRSDVTHDFQDELIALTTVAANIIVDFREVTYIAPSVQHSLLTVQQKMDTLGKGTLLLRAMPDAIYQEFEKSGEAELLMIEK